MNRSVTSRVAGLVWLAMAVSGCDSSVTGPDTPKAPTRPLEVTTGASGTKEIVLILPSKPHRYESIWEQSARVEASSQQVLLTTERPPADAPASRQAELIREVAKRVPTAILVVPGDPKAIAPALAEVRDQGVAVITLDRAVPVAGKPIPVLTYASLREPTREMIQAAVRDARALGYPPDGPAMILSYESDDPETLERVNALEEALKEAKVKMLPRARFGQKFGSSEKVIKAALEKYPELAIIAADEDRGVSSAVGVRHGLTGRKRFTATGFVFDKKNLELIGYGQCPGLVDMRLYAIGRQAVRTALDLAARQPTPDRIEVPRPFVSAAGEPLTQPVQPRPMGGPGGRELPAPPPG